MKKAGRKSKKQKRMREYYLRNRDEILFRMKLRYQKNKQPTAKRCSICGGTLENGHQKFCLDCIIKAYINGNTQERRQAMNRLKNRGINTSQALIIAHERGII